MKKTLIATILMGIAFVALPAMAGDSTTLMIFSFHQAGDGFTGSFNASGAIHEAATADATVDPPDGSGILTAHKTIYLTGGVVEMAMRGPMNVTFPGVSLIGTWEFTGGTGIYSGVSGHGTCVVVGDLTPGATTFSGAYLGKVKLVGDKGDND